MTIHVHQVATLEGAVGPLAELLAAPVGDVFAPELVVVPAPGVRHWLRERLAGVLGAAPGRGDGIVANVEWATPWGLAARTLGADAWDDPWDPERLAFTLLDLLWERPELVPGSRRLAGNLPAARGIAGLFDRYHQHRSGMILAWAGGAAVLEGRGEGAPGDPGRAEPLPSHAGWQFELWRAARERLAAPSPPERVTDALARLRDGVARGNGGAPATLPPRIAVLGAAPMTPLHLDLLQALAVASDVHLWLSYPSPGLARVTAERLGAVPLGPRLPAGENPARGVARLPQLDSWTRPSQALQVLLVSAGIDAPPPPDTHAAAPDAPAPLLARVQRALLLDETPANPMPLAPADRSLQLHRCHGGARQAEVLRDALLHAFREIPGLEARDVLVVSPDIASIAPHLVAVFGDPRSHPPDDDPLHVPLVVADRSLRQTDEAAELIARLLELPGRRIGFAEFRQVAGLEGVRLRLGVTPETVENWLQWAGQLRVRWGLTSAERRATAGLPDAFSANTWLHALRRLAYGALVPDAPPVAGHNDVVPVNGVEVGDLPSLGALCRLLGTLIRFTEEATGPARPVSEWCDLLVEAVDALHRSPREDEPQRARLVRLLGGVRERALVSTTPVPFDELRALLQPLLAGDPPFLDLRSGRVTATSLRALAGVPYRVVCIVGIDDGAFHGGGGDGDDLLRQRPLVGDPDPTGEQREALLRALLAARDRVIVTCNGRDPRNNQEVHPVTAVSELAELVAAVAGEDAPWTVDHPRHAIDPRNFRRGALGCEAPFGHREAQLHAARVLAGGNASRNDAAHFIVEPPRPDVLDADDLARLLLNPAEVYVRTALGADVWEGDGDPDATIPLRLDKRDFVAAAGALLDAVRLHPLDPGATAAALPAWRRQLALQGMLPPGAWAEEEEEDARALVQVIQSQCAVKGVPMTPGREADVRAQLADGRAVTMRAHGIFDDAPGGFTLVDVSTAAADNDRRRARQRIRTWLWALHAGSTDVRSFGIGMGPKREQCYAIQGSVGEVHTPASLQGALEALTSLHDEAGGRPFPAFGDTARAAIQKDLDTARNKFGSFCSRRLKPYTVEHRLFGPDPDFDEIFTDEALDFFRRLFTLAEGAVTVGNHRKSQKKWP